MLGNILGGIAGAVVGGLFGREQDRENRAYAAEQTSQNNAQNIEFQREMAARNEALQREFAQMGVRWRVSDAVNAGLHPVFALTGGGAAFAPNPVAINAPPAIAQGTALRDMGQNLSRAVMAQESVEQQQIREANLRIMAAQERKEHAMASFYESEAARNRQGAVASAPMPPAVPPSGDLSDRRLMFDVTKPKADEPISRMVNEPSITAGEHAFWQKYEIKPGVPLLLPRSDEGPSESLQDLPYWMYPVVIKKNVDTFGWGWLREAIKLYPGLDSVVSAVEKMRERPRGPTVSGKIRGLPPMPDPREWPRSTDVYRRYE